MWTKWDDIQTARDAMNGVKRGEMYPMILQAQYAAVWAWVDRMKSARIMRGYRSA